MDAKAKAPKEGCLTTHCESLTLLSPHDNEQEFLAALYDAMCVGGVVLIARLGHPDISITFPRK